MKRMLFNATQAEELRVAIVDGQKLIDLDIESAAKEQRKSNIYKAVITRLEPSLEAAFVDYGAERHGFLPFKEVSRAYFKSDVEASRARIQDALHVGQEIIVQVEKDERGNKGAALTTYISLAGRYLVLMPNNPRGGGVSRRVEGDERAELRDVLDQLDVTQGMSLIARTAAIGRTAEELQWDLNYLMQLWTAIAGAADSQNGAFLIYQEGSLVIRAIRDYFQPDIGEILVDTEDVFEQAHQFMAHVMPGNVNRVKFYRDDVPLFSRFQIEHQIESAYSRQVSLPSGGAIVIDHTEALVSVDVNSGRATRGADIEETAFRTNSEAADEIARQLRLRDLGGLIVIDFIDMESQRNQREVETRLRDALHHDRARVQTGKISRFGLLELSRQRLRPALAETSYITCPRCTGTGHIRSTESAALHILRILEEEAMKENTAAIQVQIPVDVATFLLNEKRGDIQTIELRQKVTLTLIPNVHLETPAHHIVRLRHDQLNQEDVIAPSYQMMEVPQADGYAPAAAQAEARAARPQAAVRGITPAQPAPVVEHKSDRLTEEQKPGFLQRIFSFFRGEAETTEVAANDSKPAPRRRESSRDGSRRSGQGRGRGGERGERTERGGRGERTERTERTERGERTELGERTERAEPRAARTEGESREQKPRQPRPEGREGGEVREGRGPRQPRQPRAAASADTTQAVTTATPETQGPAIEAGEEGTQPARGRRNRRGGRRERGEGRGEGRGPAEPTQAMEQGEAQTPVAAAVVAEPARREAAAPAREVERAASERETPALERVAAPEPKPAQAVEIVEVVAKAAPAAPVAPAPLPAVAPEQPKAQKRAAVSKPIDLSKTLSESGLVMIETQADQPAAAAPAAPAPQLGRRRSKPAEAATSEPLMQIETQQK